MVGVIWFFKMSKMGNIVKKLKNHCLKVINMEDFWKIESFILLPILFVKKPFFISHFYLSFISDEIKFWTFFFDIDFLEMLIPMGESLCHLMRIKQVSAFAHWKVLLHFEKIFFIKDCNISYLILVSGWWELIGVSHYNFYQAIRYIIIRDYRIQMFQKMTSAVGRWQHNRMYTEQNM